MLVLPVTGKRGLRVVEHHEDVPQHMAKTHLPDEHRPAGVEQDRRKAVLVDERGGEPEWERDRTDRNA
jgi:hypothetical protein